VLHVSVTTPSEALENTLADMTKKDAARDVREPLTVTVNINYVVHRLQFSTPVHLWLFCQFDSTPWCTIPRQICDGYHQRMMHWVQTRIERKPTRKLPVPPPPKL
jgi:hypothetical protein